MESHYCRLSSTKIYLEPVRRSKTKHYKFYKDNVCSGHGLDYGSINIFSQIFVDLNLSLYTQNKHLCNVYEAYKAKNASEETYNLLQIVKQEARAKSKGKHKLTTDLSVNVYGIDLQ